MSHTTELFSPISSYNSSYDPTSNHPSSTIHHPSSTAPSPSLSSFEAILDSLTLTDNLHIKHRQQRVHDVSIALNEYTQALTVNDQSLSHRASSVSDNMAYERTPLKFKRHEDDVLEIKRRLCDEINERKKMDDKTEGHLLGLRQWYSTELLKNRQKWEAYEATLCQEIEKIIMEEANYRILLCKLNDEPRLREKTEETTYAHMVGLYAVVTEELLKERAALDAQRQRWEHILQERYVIFQQSILETKHERQAYEDIVLDFLEKASMRLKAVSKP